MGSSKVALRLASSSQCHLCPSQDPEMMSGLRKEEGGWRERLRTSNVLAFSLTVRWGTERELIHIPSACDNSDDHHSWHVLSSPSVLESVLSMGAWSS